MMAQSSDILSSLSLSRFFIDLKFKVSIQVSSLTSSMFVLETVAATPSAVASFRNIVLSDDYNSIARVLRLYFEELPSDNGTYVLKITGLRSANGVQFAEETIDIVYAYDNAIVEPPPADVDTAIAIEDKSIQGDLFIASESIFVANPDFFIVSTSPENGSVFIDEDHNAGRIKVTLSRRPSLAFVNSSYIKVQRKKVAGGAGRWENLDAQFSLDSQKPILYIDVPSGDATPSYYTSSDGKVYFESGYKYRVRLNGEIAAQGA